MFLEAVEKNFMRSSPVSDDGSPSLEDLKDQKTIPG